MPDSGAIGPTFDQAKKIIIKDLENSNSSILEDPMSQTSYSRDTKVAIEVVVYCPKFMLQYVVHNNIIIMKYSSPSIVILSLNSKRIRCFFRALF